jgi:hypothetical protein
MSSMSFAVAPWSNQGPPHRARLAGVFLVVAAVVIAAFAIVLPSMGKAMAVSGGDTYYEQNGTCYVETTAATGLNDADAAIFVSAMQQMLGKVGHASNYTYTNGTVTATATVQCPDGTPITTDKNIITTWIVPAIGVVAGLVAVVAASLAMTEAVNRLRGLQYQPVDPTLVSNTQVAISGVGGFIATFMMAYSTSRQWEPSLSSGITAIFTTAAVTKWGFAGLQDTMRAWIVACFTGIAGLTTSAISAIRSTATDLQTQTQDDLAQERA